MSFSYTIYKNFLCFVGLMVLGAASADAVTGGVETTAAVHSSVVNIVYEKTVCSGVALAPNVVISANHCRAHGEPLVVSFLVGNSRSESAPCNTQKVIDVAGPSSLIGESDTTKAPDLLLMRLEAPLCGVIPARRNGAPLDFGETVSAAGHGMWEFGYGQSAQVNLTLIPFSEAGGHTYGKRVQRFINNFLDNGQQNYLVGIPQQEQNSTCVGDSGGPVFTEDEQGMTLYGVNGLTLANENLGPKKCGYGYVHLFTPIAPYMNWIDSNLAAWSPETMTAADDLKTDLQPLGKLQ